MLDWLLEPLTFSFVVRGLIAGLLAALACATLSAFVVWRGMAFVGDALAHAILPGIVVAYALGISLFFGALGAAVLAVAGIGLFSRGGHLKEDTAIGVIFAGFFALGIFLLSRMVSYQDLGHILFGNILGVGTSDLIAMVIVVAIVILGVAVAFKELLVTSFDPSHAVAIGLSPDLLRYGLLMLLALTTVVAIQTVGVVLVLALLVTPGAAASMISRRISRIMVWSVIFSTGATVIGFYMSYYWNVASGSAIVLTLTVFFLIAWVTAAVRRAGRSGRRREAHAHHTQESSPRTRRTSPRGGVR
ncbi:MAG: metal ABC transporter permease [Spirochaeta sp.]|jgi:ABC-type Mn2+/Zn2+ transport system permease subunit|nr:metal ABC transporter permease [Spirochaeta sp.]